jgi:hypothetical protein
MWTLAGTLTVYEPPDSNLGSSRGDLVTKAQAQIVSNADMAATAGLTNASYLVTTTFWFDTTIPWSLCCLELTK